MIDQAALAAIACRAPLADQGDIDLGADVRTLREAGALVAPLPCGHGGAGWGTEPGGAGPCLQALRALGRVSLPTARLFEGHVNAIKLIGLYGQEATRRRAFAAVRQGLLLGVWGADAAGRPLRQALQDGRVRLAGAKQFASGLGCVGAAVVSAQTPQGAQLLLAPTDGAGRMDKAAWRMAGMRATASGIYDFDGLALDADALLGDLGDYEREPHFEGGVWRYCAAHLGGAEALYAAMRESLAASGRACDPHQQTRLAHAAMACETARLWISEAARKVEAEGAAPGSAAYSLLAREATETCCRSVIGAAERALGMRAHEAGSGVERLRRDLSLFLCQAAPDAKLARAARALTATGAMAEDL